MENNPYRAYDDQGRWWNGNECPKCKTSSRASQKKTQTKRELLGPESPHLFRNKPKVKRHCRACNKILGTGSYFYHTKCRPFAFQYADTETYRVNFR